MWLKDFMVFLRKITPIKYKLILKKAYSEIMNNIDELTQQDYIKD